MIPVVYTQEQCGQHPVKGMNNMIVKGYLISLFFVRCFSNVFVSLNIFYFWFGRLQSCLFANYNGLTDIVRNCVYTLIVAKVRPFSYPWVYLMSITSKKKKMRHVSLWITFKQKFEIMKKKCHPVDCEYIKKNNLISRIKSYYY